MTSYNSQNFYQAKLKRKTLLNKKGSVKKTYEIVLDIQGSGITFQPGDYLAIQPQNDPLLVSRCLHAMDVTGKETIFYERFQTSYILFDFLKNIANISKFSSKLLKLFYQKIKDIGKKKKLELLLQNKDTLTKYLHTHELWDMLEEFYTKDLSYQEIASSLTPLIPRLYSISSSLRYFPEEIHLTIAYLSYVTSGRKRQGVTTHFLCYLADKNTPINVYLQPTDSFFLPKDSVPIIMIGSGSGIAPFCSFMQERYIRKAAGKNWLFFGECHRAFDFYYEDFWLQLEKENFLTLDLAFSRDQKEKIYVQHRLLEKSKKLWKWIEKGAYLYVCGSAKKMAKDVEHALKTILKQEGKMKEEMAMQYLISLRNRKRYIKDVY